ncbi:MAG: hypothetical protein R2845_10680 [Thermomicrobiales bacterium]
MTGGNQPGDRYTEAESSYMWLVDRGVLGLMRSGWKTSAVRLKRTSPALRRSQAEGLKSALIVSDAFHLFRSYIADWYGIDGYGLPAEKQPDRSLVGQ